jgi:hypothetical protein
VEVDHPPINLIDRALFREQRQVTRGLAADPDTMVAIVSSAVPSATSSRPRAATFHLVRG